MTELPPGYEVRWGSAVANPAHLFLGTHQDNMRDMHAKGRGRNSG